MPSLFRSAELAARAREYVWLYDRRRGVSCEDIAREAGIDVKTVRAGIAQAETTHVGESRRNDSDARRVTAVTPALSPPLLAN